MENRILRPAATADVPAIQTVLQAARQIMWESGNLRQWGPDYPPLEAILSDIRRGGGFVFEQAGDVVAYFALLPSPEPTYREIRDGAWLDDLRPYHVVHRIASLPSVHGIFRDIMDFCFSRDANIRIDTHRDNAIMRHNLLKYGFSYCGIIHVSDGSERLAYQRIAKIV